MKLTLLADDRVRYELASGPMTVEAPTAETEFGPFHMLGGALAACTMSVLGTWAGTAKLSLAGLAVEVAWTFAEKPHRVSSMTVEIVWPALPPERMEAAKRAAALCTVHQTLAHPPALTTVVRGAPAGVAPAASGEAA